ncbi:MAG: flagellar hook-basal body complex protein FliE [Alphaproteobacteria bacterium]|nr:flagellar hook-basal body complex protein FliE [Alphaproteobacteria bacterium]
MIPIITAVAGVLSALSSLSNLSGTSAVAGSDPTQLNTSGASATTFSDALQSALNRADEAIATANHKAKSFAAGDQSVSLSDVMVSLEQANLALQAASAVRDKVVAAYSNVMNMPI